MGLNTYWYFSGVNSQTSLLVHEVHLQMEQIRLTTLCSDERGETLRGATFDNFPLWHSCWI